MTITRREDKPLITVSLVNYNGIKTIAETLQSAFLIAWPNLEFFIIDQNSTDGSREYIEEFLKTHTMHCPVMFIRREHNSGFAGGHNEVIRQSRGEFFFCLNPDVVIGQNDFFERALEPFYEDALVGAVQPKLLRYDIFAKRPAEKDGKEIIDTTGLLMLKNRRIINRGQGFRDEGQFASPGEVFGADGAAPLYRRSALEDVKLPIYGKDGKETGEYEYFDEDFFAYKEEVDLAWRMRLFGWKAAYCPSAVAYHVRGSGESAALGWTGVIKERRKISPVAKAFSFRNQRYMQIKNEWLIIFLKHLPRFFFKEMLAWGYVVMFETAMFFKVVPQIYRNFGKMLLKRKYITARRRATREEMERWFK